ncbi:hypothetical protein VP01_2417g3 [Puccinia sorghi]|uniref:Uncharacterized protein n=1 Tax=Puccinia sorghi TaxID=27349 RepID=A0A0L6V787_9BASI|nr:hypothetical protein VP01_2417g3 [Puccinia sorghi]
MQMGVPSTGLTDLEVKLQECSDKLSNATAHHYLHCPPGDTSSQWDLINDYLEMLRAWGLVQKQA